MPAQRIDIEQFLSLALLHPVLDVRSPGEFKHAHIPGAVSFPLFTDEERKIVGTTYKQKSREDAIKIGLDFFGPTLKQRVQDAERIANGSKILLVHCWRGGMRSAAISWLLDLFGFKIYTLSGGYKAYRNWVLAQFKKDYPFQLIGGYTGSGKTELLNQVKKERQQVIDLEALAGHKGSAFGNIGLPPQPGQEQFENKLAQALQNCVQTNQTASIWLEDESQRIGTVNIPNELWATMRKSPVYFLDIPFEKRLEHIVEEYGQLDRDAVIAAIVRITKKLGHQQAQQSIDLFQENNTTASFAILLRYYDKFYARSLQNREGLEKLLIAIPSNQTGAGNVGALLEVKKI
ncbi:MAG: tRNA 2-selenouridine(34) synthase MnmH [Bacteroidetes bacterium]|nr:tRNA 2-selenouridine(34) synthase MnmH [Bacteroidota bacterium]